jgi:murein DD-endopeptidase MepM/ murein hydrolase activator NlpD
MTFRLVSVVLLTALLAAGGAGDGLTAKPPVVSASSYGIAVIAPGQAGASAASATAPGPVQTGVADGFAYPADGSIARTGALASSVAAQTIGAVGGQGVTDVLAISLFNGEITADAAGGRANAAAAGANVSGSSVTNLVLAGQAASAAPNQRFQLGDWGYAVTLEQGVTFTTAADTRDARAALTALHIVLTADHGGLPAGSEILVGHAEAAASTPVTIVRPGQAEPPGKPAPKPTPRSVPKAGSETLPTPPEPKRTPGPIYKAPPPDVSAPLSPGGYVFPVYGPCSFGDTFKAPRADVSWHHGEDIFAPLGTPLLAVADGTIFSVGWNDLGGYRLWLRDRQGNQFYYAHLSAFSALARNGNEVHAGDVVGFVGNTGDAQTTPYHLHFEIHPVGLLPLGYDGVVRPYSYLLAWRRLQDVSFAAGLGWAPPAPSSSTAPRPGAFLLGQSDISSASGLEPGSLERALVAPVSSENDGVLLRNG